MSETIKTSLIGVIAIASLLAGALLSIPAAKAQERGQDRSQGFVGDIRDFRPDPGANPANSPRDDDGRDVRARQDEPHRFGHRRRHETRTDTHIVATASAGGVPAWVREEIGLKTAYGRAEEYALKAALRSWADKAAARLGPRFANWDAARDKRISCQPTDGDFICEVSGIPSR